MFTVNVKIIPVHGLFIAVTKLGGMTIRGGTRHDETEAVRSLFQVLAGDSGNADDSLLALTLAIADTTLDVAMLENNEPTT